MTDAALRLTGLAVCLACWNAQPATAGDNTRQFPATAIACSADGRWLASVGESELCLHDPRTLAIQRRFTLPLSQAFDVAFVMPDQQLLVCGGTPGEVGGVVLLDMVESTAADAATTGPALRLVSHREVSGDVIYAVTRHQDYVVAAGHDRGLYRLSLSDTAAAPEAIAAAHSRSITDVVSAASDDLLVSCGADNTIRVWSADATVQLRAFNNHAKAVRQLAFRPAQNAGLPLLASAADDRTVRFWQPTIGRMVRFKRLSSPATSVTWVSDGSVAVVGRRDGKVCFVNPQTLEVACVPVDQSGWITCLAALPGSTDAIAGTTSGRLSRVNLPAALRE